VSRSQQSEVIGHVSTALSEGATVLAGRQCWRGRDSCTGLLRPSHRDGRRDRRHAKSGGQEVFGPVVAVLSVSSLDEAIETSQRLGIRIVGRLVHQEPGQLGRVPSSYRGRAGSRQPSDFGLGMSTSPSVGSSCLDPLSREQGLEALGFYTRTQTWRGAGGVNLFSLVEPACP